MRAATGDDIEAILALVEEAPVVKRTLEGGTEIRSDPEGIDVRYPNGRGDGDDRLTGGLGSDTYVFAPGGGVDRIDGFVSGQDVLDLADYGFASVNDVLDRAQERGGDTFIRVSTSDIIKLDGFVGLSDADILV